MIGVWRCAIPGAVPPGSKSCHYIPDLVVCVCMPNLCWTIPSPNGDRYARAHRIKYTVIFTLKYSVKRPSSLGSSYQTPWSPPRYLGPVVGWWLYPSIMDDDLEKCVICLSWRKCAHTRQHPCKATPKQLCGPWAICVKCIDIVRE